MIKKVYEIDPLICPKCEGTMRIVSFIEDHKVIDKIIKHLNLTFKAARPPPPQAQLSIAAIDNPDEEINQARELYLQGKYEDSILKLRILIGVVGQKEQFENKNEILAQSYFWLGLCFLGKGNSETAEEQFNKVLECDPEFEVDREIYGSYVVRIFKRLKLESEKVPPKEIKPPDSSIKQEEKDIQPVPKIKVETPHVPPETSTPYQPPICLIINGGLSFATGGIGGNLELQIDKFSLLGGFGIWPSNKQSGYEEYREEWGAKTVLGWDIGGKFYLFGYKGSPFIGVMFGKLLHIEEWSYDWYTDEIDHHVTDLNGFTFLTGYRFIFFNILSLTLGGGVGYVLGEIPEWADEGGRVQLAIDLTVGITLNPPRR